MKRCKALGAMRMSKRGRRGDIWLIEINNKRRPVAIVDQETMAVEVDHVVASITGQRPRNEFDVEIEHWEEAGLDKPSVVRCSKINTFHHNDLIHKIGSLHKDDLHKVLKTIQSFFSI